MAVRALNKNFLVPGLNRITFSYTGAGPGHFVEKPGPMFVLRRTAPGAADVTAPVVSGQLPAPNATNVEVKSAIIARLGDDQFGVDWTTVKLTVNDVDRLSLIHI